MCIILRHHHSSSYGAGTFGRWYGRTDIASPFLATNNLLFDEKSQRITAILGFDWAMIGSIAEEFFRSFGDIDGKLPGPYCTDPRDMAPRKALLEGFPDPLPSSHDDAHWEIAKAWDDELARKGIQRPRTIRGIDALSGVYWLSEQICPFLLCNEVVRRHRTEEQLEKDRINAEGLLTRFLEDHGF